MIIRLLTKIGGSCFPTIGLQVCYFLLDESSEGIKMFLYKYLN